MSDLERQIASLETRQRGPAKVRVVSANDMPDDEYFGDDPAPESGVPAAPDWTPTIVWADELAKPHGPIPWVCEPLCIAPGRPTVIAGEGGARKSFLAMALGLALATDGAVLGRQVRHGCSFLYADGDQGRWLTEERSQRLARASGIDLASLGRRFGYAWKPFTFDDPRIVEKLLRLLDPFDVAFFDALRRFSGRGVDENSAAASLPLEVAIEVSERTGKTIIFADHAGKPPAPATGVKPSRKHMQRGHSSKLDTSQTLIVLSGEKHEPTLVTCERDQMSGRHFPDFSFSVDDVERDGDPRWGLRLTEVVRPSNDVDSAGARYDRTREGVLRLLRKRGSMPSATSLALAVGGEKRFVLQVIKALVELGDVVEVAGQLRPGGKP